MRARLFRSPAASQAAVASGGTALRTARASAAATADFASSSLALTLASASVAAAREASASSRCEELSVFLSESSASLSFALSCVGDRAGTVWAGVWRMGRQSDR